MIHITKRKTYYSRAFLFCLITIERYDSSEGFVNMYINNKVIFNKSRSSIFVRESVIDDAASVSNKNIPEIKAVEEENSSMKENISSWPSFDKLDADIAKLAIPTIANFAIGPLIGAVDLYWVGRMGNALALAGQSAANQVFNSAFFLISYLPSVTATLVSTQKAKNSNEGVQDAVCQALFISGIFGILGTLLLLLKPETVLKSVLKNDAQAMIFAKPYLFMRSFGFLASIISNVSYSAFRGVLDTVTPLYISLSANILNCILDPILIFRYNMGVTGAAVATLTAEVVMASVFLYALLKRKMIQMNKIFSVPSWTKLSPLIKGSSSLFLRNLALNFTFLFVTRVTQSIDTTGVAAAAHSITIQVFYLGGVVLLALSAVAQILIPSQLVTKVDPHTKKVTGGVETAKITSNRMMAWGLILGTTLGAIQVAVIPLIHKLTPLPQVQKAAKIPSYIASLLQIINGLVFVGEGVMIGCSNYLQLAISTIVSTIATITALTILPNLFGLTGVWMSFGVFNFSRLIGVYLHQTRYGPLASKNIRKLQNKLN